MGDNHFVPTHWQCLDGLGQPVSQLTTKPWIERSFSLNDRRTKEYAGIGQRIRR